MFETDDDDFSLTPSSKLSSIFSTSTISDDNNASLTYKAPKQPKPIETSQSSHITNSLSNTRTFENQPQIHSSVILAKVVTLWKLENGKNTLMGKYMVALIGNLSTNLFEIIIYQDKTKIMIRLTLGNSLSFYKYPNNFVAFYDLNRQLWNLNFDDKQAKDEFLEFVNKYECNIIEQTETDTATSLNNNIPEVDVDKSLKTTCQEELSSKERILSRITKMGQPIFPKTAEKTKNSDISDSETESSLSSDAKPIKPANSAPRKLKRNLVNQEKALAPVSNDNFNQPYNNNGYFMPHNQMMLNNQGLMHYPPSHALPDYGFSNFMIAQNAELKANLAEINLKLNNFLSNSDKNFNNNEEVSLQSKIKCQNLRIDNLTADLERSKKAFEDLQKKFDELNNKKLNYEGVDIELAILREKVQKMHQLDNEVETLKNELKEKEKIIENQCLNDKKIEEFTLKLNKYETIINKTNEELKEKDTKIEIQNLKLKDFEGYFNETEKLKKENLDLKQKLINKETSTQNQIDKDLINKLIKESMNEAFRTIMENFEENQTYSFQNIQNALLENLKKTSYRLMNSLTE